ncbi:hypothetical protein STEG23_007703 [Scotinomys teguina]
MTSDSLKSPTEMPCCEKGEHQDSATIKTLHHKKVGDIVGYSKPWMPAVKVILSDVLSPVVHMQRYTKFNQHHSFDGFGIIGWYLVGSSVGTQLKIMTTSPSESISGH